nr:tetratricopeptide repeat protein 27 homolog isoform X2 [Arachis hypogaea]
MSTLEPQLLHFRAYELRLIRCTLTPPPPSDSPIQSPPSDHHLHTLINHLLSSIESGSYHQALTSDASRLVFGLANDSPLPDPVNSVDSAERFYSELLHRAEFFLLDDSVGDSDKAYMAILVLCIAVAAFLGFTQCNFTGPMKGLPRCPLPMEGGGSGGEFAEWDNWARNQVMAAGSDLLGKFSNLQYIVFSKMLLMRMKDLSFQGAISSACEIRSLSWWLARVLLLQQRILDERSSSLFDLLHVYLGEASQQFGTSEGVRSYWDANLRDGECLAIVSMFHLEAGIMEYAYGRVDPCRTHFESAEMAAGLQLSVTGVLGFRTVHQVEPKAQMVLVTNTCSSNNADNHSLMGNGTQRRDSSSGDASDILMTPKLLGNYDDTKTGSQGIENGAQTTPSLTATQQAVILAHCLLIEKSSRHDELQRWDMAPYIEAIDSQHLFYFIIRCFCDILRIRWESSRSRTKERALLMMENLVQRISESSPVVAERIPLSYNVYIPSISALRKEYGELLVRCGLIGEAVKVFEDLELWDNLIYCYSLLEKKATAVELIKKRLSERPSDPRLWESAMSMNSMFPDGWFAFGAAALKARDIEKALDAFTRAVQLDPENGEAWNNIACLHMIKKKNKEAFIAFKEALKFKRNSWQLWENYSHVAIDVGNISQALEGAQMVLEMSNNKRVDTELLERIRTEVEKRRSISNSVPSVATDITHSTDKLQLDDSQLELQDQSQASDDGRSRETEQLMLLLGRVLQQIVKSGSGYGPDIWGLYAKWHRMNGDLIMCSEALLKQVRSLQGSDTWKDRDRFKKFAIASLELCKVYMEISSSAGRTKELYTADMHLKNIIKQAQSFSDTEEFRDLQAFHEEVKIKLQSNSTPT